MLEEQIIIKCGNELSDIVNAIYRCSMFLSMGYGLVYYGPEITGEDDKGEDILNEDSLCMVLTYAHKTMGFSKNDEEVVTPTIKNPLPIGIEALPAVGTQSEMFEEVDEEDAKEQKGIYGIGRKSLHNILLHKYR